MSAARRKATPGARGGVWAGAVLVLVASACYADSDSTAATSPASPGADASVRGMITYRERIALSPDAVVTVQLRNTSYADADAALIAEQIISNPGQVPIDFDLRYVSDEIDQRSTYSIWAIITEGDGRMAFANDTAYDVITRGNPRRVDMTLVMVEPPPELTPEGWSPTDPERVEAPVHVTGAEMLWDDRTSTHSNGHLQVIFVTSHEDGCYRIGNNDVTRDGNRFDVTVTAFVPTPLPWAQDCSQLDLELDSIVRLGEIANGETIHVTVNDEHEYSFTSP
ncbi:YbaY family lipoprotein [Candidatus Poriferisodalis sp.]|uniref:YbaY family lipoprotein n=1 Tax=Candidatus Poriferisodalis sp. TaxID=3101277 RepID=UPI003B02BB3C